MLGRDDRMGTAITIMVAAIVLIASIAFAFLILDTLLVASFQLLGAAREIIKLLGA